ncbi:MAG: RibD family protein [Turicibacter sp.]
MANIDKVLALTQQGITVLTLKSQNGRVDLQALMISLGKLNIDSILLEGGSTLNYAALESGIVDKAQFYIAPKIIGGEHSKTPVGGEGIHLLSEAFKVDDLSTTFIGPDLLVEGYIRKEE